jgi:hypothetical protein
VTAPERPASAGARSAGHRCAIIAARSGSFPSCMFSGGRGELARRPDRSREGCPKRPLASSLGRRRHVAQACALGLAPIPTGRCSPSKALCSRFESNCTVFLPLVLGDSPCRRSRKSVSTYRGS